MYTKKKVGLDLKHDLIIGPGKKFQVLTVRTLANTKFKIPVFGDFDRRMTKNLLNEIIFALESICNLRIVASICDQAGENQGTVIPN